jgi:hypothetical protein
MQTFLPVPNFRASAIMLDKKRLGKQRTEAFQILTSLGDDWALAEREWRIQQGFIKNKPLSVKGWSKHPAAKMWKGYEYALRHYMNATIEEWINRGGNNTLRLAPVPMYTLPNWISRDDVHSSHRSRLIFKGTIDLLAQRIRTVPGVGRGANKWLKSRGLPELNLFTIPDREHVHKLLDNMGVPPITDNNWYDRFQWSEDDTQQYVWPV